MTGRIDHQQLNSPCRRGIVIMNSAIITITDMTNYGNRLQNYAVYTFIEEMGLSPCNLCITDIRKKTLIRRTRKIRKRLVKKIIPASLLQERWNRKRVEINPLDKKKMRVFTEFSDKYMRNQYIELRTSRQLKGKDLCYDYLFAGSDQIWNPDFEGNDFYFLNFVKPEKRIAFSASIGYEDLTQDVLNRYIDYWKQMRYISVREDSAADIIEKATGRRPDVFLDPTMLLKRSQWESIISKPEIKLPERYVVYMFLGDIPTSINDDLGNVPTSIMPASEEEQSNIKATPGFTVSEDIMTTFMQKVKSPAPEVVILNDKNYPDYYLLGPDEFLYMIKYAEKIYTDSFHCAVFSILFHKQFWVFKRKDDSSGNMFTRLETLLNKFGFTDRVWEDSWGVREERCQKKKTTNAKNNVLLSNNNIELCSIAEDRFIMADQLMRHEKERVTEILKKELNL